MEPLASIVRLVLTPVTVLKASEELIVSSPITHVPLSLVKTEVLAWIPKTTALCVVAPQGTVGNTVMF